MTFEEKGAYLELLLMQFNRGHMTSDMVGQVVGQLWDKIQVKFEQDASGLWFNARLDQEKDKRQNFTNSRKNNLLGRNQHSKEEGHKEGHLSGHTTSRMENENRNVNINDNVGDRGMGKGVNEIPIGFFSDEENISNPGEQNLPLKAQKENTQAGGRGPGAEIPPKAEAVKQYFTEKGRSDLWEGFMDYWQAKGWKMGASGKAPMKDWQAACRTWIRNSAQFGPKTGNSQLPQPPVSRSTHVNS